ncbi:polysaccharide deacetylase family protein [Psychrosphaera algicola]|uniref:Polysaccharide deacetylase family protein n=1 Tax=Psychrosphaera algicola TaxID=3023714 RepID=A0ABT5FGQ6_9GAMM|nr:polysaccharide deacetylase family protein [Psychrosphaera sp. G1-22]MDC2890016.1 polysaccharide deacetylase family protein [Psychrosphaera sp. G1-22]
MALTFDDGYLDNYTNALPILEKYNIKASFLLQLMAPNKGGYGMINSKPAYEKLH